MLSSSEGPPRNGFTVLTKNNNNHHHKKKQVWASHFFKIWPKSTSARSPRSHYRDIVIWFPSETRGRDGRHRLTGDRTPTHTHTPLSKAPRPPPSPSAASTAPHTPGRRGRERKGGEGRGGEGGGGAARSSLRRPQQVEGAGGGRARRCGRRDGLGGAEPPGALCPGAEHPLPCAVRGRRTPPGRRRGRGRPSAPRGLGGRGSPVPAPRHGLHLRRFLLHAVAGPLRRPHLLRHLACEYPSGAASSGPSPGGAVGVPDRRSGSRGGGLRRGQGPRDRRGAMYTYICIPLSFHKRKTRQVLPR